MHLVDWTPRPQKDEPRKDKAADAAPKLPGPLTAEDASLLRRNDRLIFLGDNKKARFRGECYRLESKSKREEDGVWTLKVTPCEEKNRRTRYDMGTTLIRKKGYKENERPFDEFGLGSSELEQQLLRRREDKRLDEEHRRRAEEDKRKEMKKIEMEKEAAREKEEVIEQKIGEMVSFFQNFFERALVYARGRNVLLEKITLKNDQNLLEQLTPPVDDQDQNLDAFRFWKRSYDEYSHLKAALMKLGDAESLSRRFITNKTMVRLVGEKPSRDHSDDTHLTSRQIINRKLFHMIKNFPSSNYKREIDAIENRRRNEYLESKRRAAAELESRRGLVATPDVRIVEMREEITKALGGHAMPDGFDNLVLLMRLLSNFEKKTE